MSALVAERLVPLVTRPYRRGAELKRIALGADDGAGFSAVSPYDFSEYRARWNNADPEAPRYVISPTSWLGPEPIDLEVVLNDGAADHTVTVRIPAYTPALLSFAIPQPDGAGPEWRVVKFRQHPRALVGAGADNWRLVALLGNLSKLLWVVGREQDEVRARLDAVLGQRHRTGASRASLDLLGSDLGVARFPPRPYSFDPDTIALYHLTTHPVPTGDPVLDETTRFGLAGHDGTNHEAKSGALGRFGSGFQFGGQAAPGRIEIPHHTDFDVPVARDLTVEFFALLGPHGAAGLRAFASKGSLDAAGNLTAGGWAITTGDMRGIADNLRCEIRAGAATIELFADSNLADGRFHHVALALDRTLGRARLWVDGAERMALAFALGAVANAAPVRIGGSDIGHALSGVLSELRFSSVARSTFHPVLGESDDAYRRRLAIFEDWRLPSAAALEAMLNQAADPIGSDDKPFIVIEEDRHTETATRLLRFVPDRLAAGSRIDAEGNLRTSLERAAGQAEDEPGFREEFLLRHDDPRVDYGGEEAPRRMQAGCARALDGLLDLLEAEGIAGLTRIRRAFAPEGPDLHAVGRALEISHAGLSMDVLAARAHQAGFDFVHHRGLFVLGAVAPDDALEIDVPTLPGGEPDVIVHGAGTDVTLQPSNLPAAGQYEWTVVPCGAGRARIEPHSGDPPGVTIPAPRRKRVRIVPEHPGELVLSVEYRVDRVTITGSRTLRVTLSSLADLEHISADGDLEQPAADAVGSPEGDFDVRYLLASGTGATADAGVDFRAQLGLERGLERLLARLAPSPASELHVTKAFDPLDPGLHSVGRAVTLRHDTVTNGRLAALAHDAGFRWVERRDPDVFCAVAIGERFEAVRAGGGPIGDVLPTDGPVDLELRPSGLETNGTLNWSLDPVGRGRGTLSHVLAKESRLTPIAPGLVGLQLLYLEDDPDRTAPYTFDVRLKPALEAANEIIPKDQYDLVMNVLAHFHPIGVEVLTGRIRQHVVEVQGGPSNAFPGYTYPEFRP